MTAPKVGEDITEINQSKRNELTSDENTTWYRNLGKIWSLITKLHKHLP